MFNDNFKSIIWLAGYFGIVIREHVEQLVYRNKYSHISSNRTLSKLEKEYRFLKRIDRGKRKSNGFKLTHDGVKEYRRLFGEEPKIYNSGDKLSHAIQVLNFYVHIINDMRYRGLLKDDYIIIEEKEKILYDVQKKLKFMQKDKEKIVIPDSFIIYRYMENRGIVGFLEIENSDRKAHYVASKTINNYEGYYLSGKWKKEPWQPKNTKIFPPVLVVCYSEYKVKEFIRQFSKKRKIDLAYYFTDYKSLKSEGLSGNIWFNITGERFSLLS